MAGGMNRRDSVRTNPSLLAARPAQRTAPRRHCWVRGPDGAEWPGLVLEWRRDRGSWHARVMYVPEDDLAVETWLPAGQVRPHD
jgi:hypothetical protein